MLWARTFGKLHKLIVQVTNWWWDGCVPAWEPALNHAKYFTPFSNQIKCMRAFFSFGNSRPQQSWLCCRWSVWLFPESGGAEQRRYERAMNLQTFSTWSLTAFGGSSFCKMIRNMEMTGIMKETSFVRTRTPGPMAQNGNVSRNGPRSSPSFAYRYGEILRRRLPEMIFPPPSPSRWLIQENIHREREKNTI